MNKRMLLLVVFAALGLSLQATADDDVDKAISTPHVSGPATLTAEQRHALGIVVGRPLLARIPDHIDSLGLVLDPTTLVADMGDLTAVDAAERTAKAEVTRLQGLYGNSAGA